MTKRLFDLFCSIFLLLVLFPLFLIIAIVIKITSQGPIIFKQQRMGYKGKTFIILKFRTMINNSAKPFDIVLKGDQRITPIGKLLRSTHLDELPQLWNVMKGEMSLVGPRPSTLDFSEKYLKKFPLFKKRFSVRPGITGPSQLFGRLWIINNRQTFVALDAEYASKQNLFWDLKILFKTIPIVLKRQGF